MHPFFAAFRIQCVELSVTWFVLGIYIYEKLRIHENTRGFVRLYEEVKIMGERTTYTAEYKSKIVIEILVRVTKVPFQN